MIYFGGKSFSIKIIRKWYFLFDTIFMTAMVYLQLRNLLLGEMRLKLLLSVPIILFCVFLGTYVNYWLYACGGYYLCYKNIFCSREEFEKMLLPSIFIRAVVNILIWLCSGIFLVNLKWLLVWLPLVFFNGVFGYLLYQHMKGNKKVFIVKMIFFILFQLLVYILGTLLSMLTGKTKAFLISVR